MRRVLMIAFHFPPQAGSSGVQRTLRFVQHLREYGWIPVVLTARAFAYDRVSADLLAEVPASVQVERTFALDTARHLSLMGRYPRALALPDRWSTWRFSAVRRGLRLIAETKPDVIWSTYPIATAHAIAATLHRRTGLPWLADFRDPMAQDGYPADPETWRAFERIERDAVSNAHFSIFTTDGAASIYRKRYAVAADRIVVVENGFDEESFANLDGLARAAGALNPGAITLLHSGVVYPEDRDPSALFEAVRGLADGGGVTPQSLRLRFRAPVHGGLLARIARTYGVEAFVEWLPPIDYRDALLEMMRADGLMLLQAKTCNEQVPAKLYEYIRAGKPILGFVDPAGETARKLRAAGVSSIADLACHAEIGRVLTDLIRDRDASAGTLVDEAYVASCSRRSRTAELAGLLDQCKSYISP